jgi:hypothetical protein
MFRVRDSIGQNITIDPEESTIEITNNGLASTQSADGGLVGSISGALGGAEDAEVIRLDKTEKSILMNSRKLITIISGGDRKDTTTGDYTKEVQGDESVAVYGDYGGDFYGGVKRTIMSDLSETIHGDTTYECTGSFSVSSVQDIEMEAANITGTSRTGDVSFVDALGAGFKASGGKVEIGGTATGIFESTLAILDQLDAILTAIEQMTVGTGTGPSSPPINSADFIKAQTQLKVIQSKLKTVAGSL